MVEPKSTTRMSTMPKPRNGLCSMRARHWSYWCASALGRMPESTLEPSRGGNDCLAPSRRACEVVGIVWHRLCPAEEESARREYRDDGEDYRAEKIDVRDRVQGQSAGVAGGRVAQFVGGVAMRHLVDDYREDKNDKIDYLHMESSNGSITTLYGTHMRHNRKEIASWRRVFEPHA